MTKRGTSTFHKNKALNPLGDVLINDNIATVIAIQGVPVGPGGGGTASTLHVSTEALYPSIVGMSGGDQLYLTDSGRTAFYDALHAIWNFIG